MRKIFLILILLMATSAFSIEGFILGSQINSDASQLDDTFGSGNITPSLFWEIYNKNLGFGMTYTTNLLKEDSFKDNDDYDWFLDSEATIDLKYHILGTKNNIAPYTNLSFGVKSNNMLRYYQRHTSNWEKGDDGKYKFTGSGDSIKAQSLQSFHLIGRISAGLNLKFNDFFVGGNIGVLVIDNQLYNILNEVDEVLDQYRISIQVGYIF